MTKRALKGWGWGLTAGGAVVVLLIPVWFMLAAGWALGGDDWGDWFYLAMLVLGPVALVTGIVMLVKSRRQAA